MTITFLMLNIVLYCQKVQVDTFSIVGHKYLLERTKVYFIGNHDFPLNVLRTQHKVETKTLSIEIFKRGDREVEEFDAAGYSSLINYSMGKEKLKIYLYNFADSIKLNNKKLKDINIKVSGQTFQIDQAQFIASNDSCTYIISIPTGPGSETVLQKLSWVIHDLKPNAVFLTSMFYTDRFKNVNFIPIQFFLIPD